MSALARLVPLALLVACNALTGADGLMLEHRDDDLRQGRGKRDPGSSETSAQLPDDTREHRVDGGIRTGPETTPPSQTDAGFDASAPPPGVSDTFDRADTDAVGNGWIEKIDHFGISNGMVRQSGNSSFVNAILSRPESVSDVQISVDVIYNDNFDSDPTLHVRMQPSSEQMNELDGYVFFAYRDVAQIDREDPGDDGERLARTTISPMLQVGVRYRMIFRARGTNPVALEAMILKPDGSSAVTLSANDSSPRRITNPGRVGFGAGLGSGTRWDNFERSDL